MNNNDRWNPKKQNTMYKINKVNIDYEVQYERFLNHLATATPAQKDFYKNRLLYGASEMYSVKISKSFYGVPFIMGMNLN